jgi:hypothetical protein
MSKALRCRGFRRARPLRGMFNSRRIGAAVVLLFAFNLAIAQASPAVRQKITIKLLNGKTGRAVWWRGLASVRVGGRESVDRRTNLLGEAGVDVTNASPAQVEVIPAFVSHDCRFSEKSQTRPLSYSVDEVRSKGIVSDNYCGTAKRDPKPGVLMIYVIPMTNRELWNE